MDSNPTFYYIQKQPHRDDEKKEEEKYLEQGSKRKSRVITSQRWKDIHNHAKRLEEEKARLARETFPELDKKLIADYVWFLEARGLSKGRLAKCLYQLRTIRKHSPCDFELLDKKSIEQIVVWINNSVFGVVEVRLKGMDQKILPLAKDSKLRRSFSG